MVRKFDFSSMEQHFVYGDLLLVISRSQTDVPENENMMDSEPLYSPEPASPPMSYNTSDQAASTSSVCRSPKRMKLDEDQNKTNKQDD